ncbi:AAA family ATPase [Brachybacterium sp. GCM10030252]|uniref:AAA family ATPase n=1 Tax=Brachybacterium sp. GCM10030252 TaxID=3273380 RepID=UPI003606E569
MKLHHLRLTGIGPFRDTVDIDLASLSTSGMFLLEGPTGSGKSTILDAIVFALYGTVAGSEASGERIRSQFADPTAPSAVDLVFETGHGIYRVRRQPQYARAKRRGTGTTKENARAILWRLSSPELIPAALADRAGDGAGVTPISTRLDEIGGEITRAVGLSREQFTQTVLLPQNEFARFLRAGTGERQTVLQRVFGTEIYQNVEKQLEQMRREAATEVTAARNDVSKAVARFAEAAGLEDEQRSELDDHAASGRRDELSVAVTSIEKALTARAEVAAEAATAATGRETTAREHADRAATHRARITRRRELDTLAARLAEEEPAARAAQRRLTCDDAARPAAVALQRASQAAQRLSDLRAAREDVAATHRESHPDLVELLDGEDPLEALAAAAEDATSAAGALGDLVDLEKALPQRAREIEARRQADAELATSIQALTEQLAARPEARQELVAERTTAQAAAEALGDARAARVTAASHLAAARDADRLAKEVTAAEKTATDALAAARRAADEEKTLRDRRHAGIASELALQLAPEEACPVCGSTEHPAPAEPAEDHVGPEQIEAAEEHRRRADEAASRAAESLTAVRTQRDKALADAGGLTLEDARTADADAQQAVEKALAAQKRAETLEKELEAHDAETTRLTQHRSAQERELEGRAASLREAETALAKDTERAREARGEHASVTERRAAQLTRARAATALREAHLAADQAAARLAELEEEAAVARAEAAEQLTAAGHTPFATDDELRAAVLAEGERAELTTLLSDRTVNQARYTDGMAEEGIAEIDASEDAAGAADQTVTAAAEALTLARTAAREAGDHAARLRASAERTAGARTALDGALDRLARLDSTAGAIVRVADLATGRSSDGTRIQLSTYVLMRRFEEVVAAANTRLAQFSDSTLELLRDTGARGAKKTGLDLLVIDHRTDQHRLPETLSGGETFFVSLALALGLADIVTAEAGGVQMETLFIDEGFGSLDPEALERVVAEIGRLAEHGRTIGIVSHVSEMKAQIAEQIHVRRLPDRSSTLSVTA